MSIVFAETPNVAHLMFWCGYPTWRSSCSKLVLDVTTEQTYQRLAFLEQSKPSRSWCHDCIRVEYVRIRALLNDVLNTELDLDVHLPDHPSPYHPKVA